MLQGFINIHRSVIDWKWYKNTTVKSVFIHLLLKANYTKKEWENIIIERGELVTGIKKLSFELDITPQKIRLALKKLENTNEISVKTTNKFSVITICNYDHYQSSISYEQQSDNKQISIRKQTENKQVTIKEHSSNNQTTTTNKVNNKKNINKDNKVKNNKNDFKINGDISKKLRLKILEFIEYRIEINKAYKSQKSIDALIKKLQKNDEEISIKQIEQSIENGWLGIFEIKKNISNKSEIYEPTNSTNTNRLNF